MPEAIAAVRKAFIELYRGEADAPLRTKMSIPGREGKALFMPVYLPGASLLAVKVITLFSGNPARGLPLVDALVMVFDGETGRPAAIMDGEHLTAMRTGAASGVATDLLARPDARILAVFGAGPQARTQAAAVAAVRPLEKILVYDPDRGKLQEFARETEAMLKVPVVVLTGTRAIREADIVCTVTSSPVPVFEDSDIQAGVHINGVGSYTPETSEIPPATVARSTIVVDQREAALSEAGDLLEPIRRGLITPEDIRIEIGAVAAGASRGRSGSEEVTFFKSLGNAVQDAAVAAVVLKNAETFGVGTMLPR
ncbi:ornithine cyclodeaminase [bacterium]|nr:ornithine cyclodeaminase [bacterium]